jgi:hypothetical protein
MADYPRTAPGDLELHAVVEEIRRIDSSIRVFVDIDSRTTYESFENSTPEETKPILAYLADLTAEINSELSRSIDALLREADAKLPRQRSGGELPMEKETLTSIEKEAEGAKPTQSAGWVGSAAAERKDQHEALEHILKWLDSPGFTDLAQTDPVRTAVEHIKLRLAALGDENRQETIAARNALLPVSWGQFMDELGKTTIAIGARRQELANQNPNPGAA